jgi:hypothetical protein
MALPLEIISEVASGHLDYVRVVEHVVGVILITGVVVITFVLEVN